VKQQATNDEEPPGEDSWPAFVVANRLETKTAKAAMLSS
jgi:hypothetical protein